VRRLLDRLRASNTDRNASPWDDGDTDLLDKFGNELEATRPRATRDRFTWPPRNRKGGTHHA